MPHLLWLTQRSLRHQKSALDAAPPNLTVTMHPPDFAKIALDLAPIEFIISERRGTLSAEILAAAPHLKLIVRLGSLVDDIDLADCQARGIGVSCQPIDGTMAVAEHLILQLLALLKRFNETQHLIFSSRSQLPPARTDENTFRYNWTRFDKIQQVRGKTLAILGMGEIGVEFTRRVAAFLPAQILYHKRTPYPLEVEKMLHLTYADFETCVTQADILVNLLPYSTHTDLRLNKGVFEQMKTGSFLVHAGSGSTLHEMDLLTALQLGKIAGAALDTFEYEPIPLDHPLVKAAHHSLTNLILTPHIAGGTGIPDRHADYAEVVRFLAGEALHWRVI